VAAGPARFVRKERLLPYIADFTERVVEHARCLRDAGDGYAITHAHFFMSGLVAKQLKQTLGIPYVVTFQSLGRVRLLHQPNDEFPQQRGLLEQAVVDDADAIIAECPQDEDDLRRHYRAPASRLRMVPRG